MAAADVAVREEQRLTPDVARTEKAARDLAPREGARLSGAIVRSGNGQPLTPLLQPQRSALSGKDTSSVRRRW